MCLLLEVFEPKGVSTFGEQFDYFSQVILELGLRVLCHVGSHLVVRHVDAFQCQLSCWLYILSSCHNNE